MWEAQSSNKINNLPFGDDVDHPFMALRIVFLYQHSVDRAGYTCRSPEKYIYRGSAARPRGAEEELSAKLRGGQDTPGGTAKTGARFRRHHGPLESAGNGHGIPPGWLIKMLMTLL